MQVERAQTRERERGGGETIALLDFITLETTYLRVSMELAEIRAITIISQDDSAEERQWSLAYAMNAPLKREMKFSTCE